MHFWNWKKLWTLLLAVLILTACPGQPGFTLNVLEARPGESVTARLSGMDGRKASVTVADVSASIASSTQTSVTFNLPDVPEGEQEIIIASEGKTAKGQIKILAKTSLTPSFTLNPTQAAPGTGVTATLVNYSANGATVTVAGETASVTSTGPNSVVFIVPAVAEGNQEVIIKSGGQEARNTLLVLPVPEVILTLDRESAARGETVNAEVSGSPLEGGILKVAGVITSFTPADADSFSFQIPENAPAGPQKVVLETSNGNAEKPLDIYGDIETGKVTLILKPVTSEESLEAQLSELNSRLGWSISLEDKNLPDSSTKLRTLGMSSGPCSGQLADIDVGDVPLGEVIRELQKLEQNGEGIAFHIDPRTRYGAGSIDHLGTIGAPAANARGHSGAGTLIAVLDTGVGNGTDDIDELGPRLRNDLAYDFVNQVNSAIDDYDQAGDGTIEGHGTPIAVLAAGSTSGVAPGAEILPVKTCDKDGICLSSDVILGMCHAIKQAQAEEMSLVINLSLGGDTPVDALEAILDYALGQNILVAAAAGNEGESGSPVHYPAAYNLPGLIAVGALEAPALTCLDFEEQTPDATFPVGQGFNDRGVDIIFKEFFFSGSGSTTDGIASIGGIATNKTLLPNNTNAEFAFEYPLDGLSLNYVDGGGNENLEVNNSLQNVEDLSSLDGITVADVQVSVSGPRAGVLRLEGLINQFAIGGQELALDNICPLKNSAWQPADFSTRGAYVDISAPGKAVRSSSPDNTYSDYEGTSFSTPLVTGALALWREANPAETAANIETQLKDSALELDFLPVEVGAGMLNLSVKP